MSAKRIGVLAYLGLAGLVVAFLAATEFQAQDWVTGTLLALLAGGSAIVFALEVRGGD